MSTRCINKKHMIWCNIHKAWRKPGTECVPCKDARQRAEAAALDAKRQKNKESMQRGTASDLRNAGNGGIGSRNGNSGNSMDNGSGKTAGGGEISYMDHNTSQDL